MAKQEIVREVNEKFDKKVYDTIRYRTSNEFSKYLILETPNLVYWAKDDFKSKTKAEVIKHNGIKEKDAIIVEGNSAYGVSSIEEFIFEPNNKYFYRIRYYVGCRVSRGYWCGRLEVKFENAVRIYPDKCHQAVGSGYRSDIRSFEDFKNGLKNSKLLTSKESKKWMGNYYIQSDIDTKRIIDPASRFNYQRGVSDETLRKFKDFFRSNGLEEKYLEEVTKHTYTINEFMHKNMKMRAAAASAKQTREKLLSEVFCPMFTKVKNWAIRKQRIPSKDFDEFLRGRTDIADPRDSYYRKKLRPCLIRYNEWIMCISDASNWGKVVFYNAKLGKKYMGNIHYDTVENFGVFNIEYFNILPTDTYTNEYVMDIYDSNARKTRYFPTDDYEYIDCLPMYDINGNEISYEECFRDTAIINIINCTKNYSHMNSINKFKEWVVIHSGEIGTKKAKMLLDIKEEDHTVEQIIKLNKVPTAYFLILCLKKEYQLAAEQLAKSGFNSLLYLMVTDQNMFKGSEETTRYYWNTMISFDKNKTNLKDCFNMSINQIRVINKLVEESKNRNDIRTINFPEVLFGKEKVRSIDESTFYDLLSYFSKANTESNTLSTLAENLRNLGYDRMLNNPKEFLTVLKKVGNISMWKDYLNMVYQARTYVENGIANINIKNYKVIPDKSTRYVTLRETTERYYQYSTGYTNRTVSAYDNYKRLSEHYKNIKPVMNDNGVICGAIIETDVEDHIRFLHDELSCIVSVYRDKERDKLFRVAAQRVKKYEWENDKIAIIAPKQASDVINDATMLHHCAASFVDPIINGTENIMFIRKKNMKDCPWYTMAIDNSGNIEQIHCMSNRNLSTGDQLSAYMDSLLPSYAEQFDFIPMLKKWAKEKGINVGSIKEHYGALGARR